LRGLSDQATTMGLSYLSTQSSVSLVEASINHKAYAQVRPQLENVLARSEKLGARVLISKLHYFIANAMRAEGNADATAQYQQTLQLLSELKQEAGAEHVLERLDLQAILSDTNRWAHPADAPMVKN
jgi:hypothetical protein